jgi:3-phenylpropionate/cinnamic acid dioxygenase small subunit
MPDSRDSRPSNADILSRANDILLREAALLDEQDYAAWLEMWTPDALYIVPTSYEPHEDYSVVLNYIHDDADMRRRRVQRLLSGGSHAMTPPPHTLRAVSLVRLLDSDAPKGEVRVSSSLFVLVCRGGMQRMIGAQVEHRLRLGSVEPIAGKVCRLLDADQAQGDLTFLI